MDRRTQVALYIALGVAIVLSCISLGRGSVYAEQTKTMQACNQAYQENDGASEELCGKMQDKTGTIYMCSTAGCWLELK